ncbi:MAG: ABC transporter substrate-binding protein [Rhodospirillaceae bacterium]|nr:ABC transporter substrate-binding protein [Rhodospirillaceae bacterium]
MRTNTKSKYLLPIATVVLSLCLGGVVAPNPAVSADKILSIGTSLIGPNRGHAYQGITMPAIMPLNAIYDTVTVVREDGSIGPGLALSWQSDDALTWRLKLREGVKFSNGVPFTADAIVRSVKHMRGPEAGLWSISTTLYQVAEARALDDYTVEVELNQRDALFPIHAAVWRILEPEAWETMPRTEYESNPVGTGPFQVTDWDQSGAEMRAFRDSWRAPKLDGLDFKVIPDQTARLQAILSGAVDFVVGLGPDDASLIEADGGRLALRNLATVQFLAFLTVNGGPVVDPKVRLALNYAVNREAIIQTLLQGKAKPLSQLAYPGAFGYDPDLPPYPYDPDLARALLAEAGYPDGIDLTASVASRGANDLLFFQQIALDLAKIGVNVEMQGKPAWRNMQDLFFGKATSNLHSLLVRGPDPLAAYRHRVCQGILPDRSPYHCDDKLLPILEQARTQVTAEAALPFYRAVLAHEREHPPGIILWQGVDFDGLTSKVTGYAPVQDVMNFSDMDLSP